MANHPSVFIRKYIAEQRIAPATITAAKIKNKWFAAFLAGKADLAADDGKHLSYVARLLDMNWQTLAQLQDDYAAGSLAKFPQLQSKQQPQPQKRFAKAARGDAFSPRLTATYNSQGRMR